MRYIIRLIILFVTVNSFSQQYLSIPFESNQLGETRDLRIFLPKSYEQDSTKLYPIAIVLDGNELFDLYVGNSVYFASKEKAPEQIVIGIDQSNKKRYSDCSYNIQSGLPEGSSDRFYKFLRSELLQYLEANYRISPFKTIVGSTLTANFTNYLLVEEKRTFNAFININPYYAHSIASMAVKTASKESKDDIYYYLCSGDYLSQKKLAGITKINRILEKVENKHFNYKYDVFDGSTKISSAGQAIPKATEYIFEIFSPITKEEFNTKIKDLSPADAIAYLEKKYVEIDYLFGANIKMRERDIYKIEPIIIEKENGEYLRDFGELIYKHYPESPLSEYYIGLDYEMRGRYKQAAEAYKEGYMKIEGDSEAADQFYKNVERVEDKMVLDDRKRAKEEKEWEEEEQEYQDTPQDEEYNEEQPTESEEY